MILSQYLHPNYSKGVQWWDTSIACYYLKEDMEAAEASNSITVPQDLWHSWEVY